jgi:transketolase
MSTTAPGILARTGEILAPASASMRTRFTDVVGELLEAHPRLAVVLADIGVDRFAASGALGRHPERVINVGIREQLMVNVAAGMALEGFRPIVHTYAPFLVERAFEQVKLGFGHQGVGGILVSVGASYDWAAGGRTHQAPEDVALISSLPGWTVHVPGHADEAEAALRDAAASDGPVYIRLSEQSNASAVARPGKVVVVRWGSEGAPAVLAFGPMLDAVTEAVADIDVTLLYTFTPIPLDAGRLVSAMTGDRLIVVEPYLEGTSAGEAGKALSHRPLRQLSIGVPKAEHRKYGTWASHNRDHGLDAPGLRARIGEWLAS